MTTIPESNYEALREQLLNNYKIWGLDNLEVIEILDALREYENGTSGLGQ